MTTRLYLQNAAAAVTPTTIRGAWDVKTLTGASLLGPSPAGTAATAGAAEATTTTNWDVLLRRWVSDPITVAGTLSGTMGWSLGALESSSTMSARTHLHAFVWRSTDTLVGTLLTDFASSTAWPTTAAARSESGQTVTSTDVQVGDRIVVEIGYRAVNTSSTSFTGTMNYGNTGTTDLSGTNANVTTRPGWVEFSGLDGLIYPEVESATDDFNDGTVDMTTWGNSYGTYSVVGGVCQISCDGTAGSPIYSGVCSTAQNYHLADSSMYIKVPMVPGANGGTGTIYQQLAIGLQAVAGTMVRILYDAVANVLSFESTVSYYDASAVQIAYNSTSHLWWRLRHAAGVMYWETSPDNSTWTTQRTLNPAPSWCNYSGNALLIECSRDGGTADYGTVDNINLNTITADASLVGAGALSADATSGSPTVNGTATITGAGTVAAGAVQGATNAPVGSGSLSAAVTQKATAGSAGAGSVTATVRQLAGSSPAGVGSLSATTVTQSATTPAGAGALTAAVRLQAGATAAGAGSLSGLVGVQPPVVVAGAGSLAVTASQQAGAALVGVGTLTASVGGTTNGTATITAAGSVVIVATQGTGTAVSGAGSLTVGAVQLGTATLAGAGALAATIRQGAGAGLAGAGSLVATVASTINGTADLVGVGTLLALVQAIQVPGILNLSTMVPGMFVTSTAPGMDSTASAAGMSMASSSATLALATSGG